MELNLDPCPDRRNDLFASKRHRWPPPAVVVRLRRWHSARPHVADTATVVVVQDMSTSKGAGRVIVCVGLVATVGPYSRLVPRSHQFSPSDIVIVDDPANDACLVMCPTPDRIDPSDLDAVVARIVPDTAHDVVVRTCLPKCSVLTHDGRHDAVYHVGRAPVLPPGNFLTGLSAAIVTRCHMTGRRCAADIAMAAPMDAIDAALRLDPSAARTAVAESSIVMGNRDGFDQPLSLFV